MTLRLSTEPLPGLLDIPTSDARRPVVGVWLYVYVPPGEGKFVSIIIDREALTLERTYAMPAWETVGPIDF